MNESTRKRGRPASIDKPTALAAMVELFRSKGFDAVSLDDLSTVTGLSRPSLYRAFGNKISMYLAAMDAFGAQVGIEAAPILRGGDDLETSLAGFYDAMLNIYFRDPDISPGCLVFATAPSSADIEVIQSRLNFGIEQLDALMRHRFKVAAPLAPRDQIETAVQLASNTLIAFSARAKSGASKSELSAMGQQAARFITQILS